MSEPSAPETPVLVTGATSLIGRFALPRLRAMGVDQQQLRAERGLQFVVVSITVDFLRPAVLHDEILVTATLERLAGATIHFKQTIERGGEQLIDATVRVACLDSGTLKPRAIPKDLFTEWRNAQ